MAHLKIYGICFDLSGRFGHFKYWIECMRLGSIPNSVTRLCSKAATQSVALKLSKTLVVGDVLVTVYRL